MSAHDMPADAGDVEALAEVVGHVLSEYLDDAAPLNERRYVVAARHVLSVDGSPGMTAYFAARDAAQRADERERIAQAIEAEAAEWEACWCGEGPHGEQEQRRDCPRHGSDDCRHMAEGFVLTLRRIARAGTAGGSDA